MVEDIIDGVKNYISKSLDAGFGIFSTGVIFSISNNGNELTNFEANWGTIIAGFSTACVMCVRVFIMIRKEIRDSRIANDLHQKELNKK